ARLLGEPARDGHPRPVQRVPHLELGVRRLLDCRLTEGAGLAEYVPVQEVIDGPCNRRLLIRPVLLPEGLFFRGPCHLPGHRRPRSFSRHFIAIQSRSPRTDFASFFGSNWRRAAIAGSSADEDSFVLGFDGSTSLMMRSISVKAAARNSFRLNGTLPVSSS